MIKNLSSRITTLQNRFIEFGIDTLMVSVEENRRYLSGFTGHDGQFDETAGALLISADRLILATDGRYTLQAKKEVPHFEITTYDMGFPKALPDLIDKLKSKRLGIESDRMSVSQFNKISEMVKANGLKTTIVPTTNMVETLRIKKDTEEIGLTKDALVCAEAAFLKVIETLQPEMTEADGIRAGELEAEFAEMDGYSAEARAGELLLGVGIPVEQHYGPMSEVAPGWKLRVLLAQVLFSEPDIMLLDEPTNNLISTQSAGWKKP